MPSKLTELRRRYLGAEDGNVLVMATFGATMLMGCMALSVDAGRLLLAQHQMQAFADAAAMAGALEINTCGSTTNCTAMQNAATSAVKDVGATSVTIVPQCGSTSGKTGLVVQLNNGPCALSSDPNYGSAGYVEAVVGEQVNTVFGTLLGRIQSTLRPGRRQAARRRLRPAFTRSTRLHPMRSRSTGARCRPSIAASRSIRARVRR